MSIADVFMQPVRKWPVVPRRIFIATLPFVWPVYAALWLFVAIVGLAFCGVLAVADWMIEAWHGTDPEERGAYD